MLVRNPAECPPCSRSHPISPAKIMATSSLTIMSASVCQPCGICRLYSGDGTQPSSSRRPTLGVVCCLKKQQGSNSAQGDVNVFEKRVSVQAVIDGSPQENGNHRRSQGQQIVVSDGRN